MKRAQAKVKKEERKRRRTAKKASVRKSGRVRKDYEVEQENRKSVKRRLIDYLVITVASLVYAVGVSLFIDPNNLAPGGVTGIAILLSRLLPVGTGTFILLLNIPIILLGIWKFGFRFILSSLYATALISFFTNLLTPYGPATQNVLLAALFGSVLVAVSIGVIFKAGATTGGTDIIIKCLRLKYPHLKTGVLFFITDMMIVSVSGFVFRDIDAALYAAIAVVVTSLVLDVVLYGTEGAKLIYIISDHSEQITSRLLEELDIGVTHMEGSGAYSGREKKVILCVMKKQLSPRVEEIVKQEDPEAFMIISSATEIFGEGYKSYFSEKI